MNAQEYLEHWKQGEATVAKEELSAGLQVLKIVADTIRELGSIPSGHLYAQLMGLMSLEQYERVIGILIRTGLVTESNTHLLTWNRP